MGKIENLTFFNFHGIIEKKPMEGWQIHDRIKKSINQFMV